MSEKVYIVISSNCEGQDILYVTTNKEKAIEAYERTEPYDPYFEISLIRWDENQVDKVIMKKGITNAG